MTSPEVIVIDDTSSSRSNLSRDPKPQIAHDAHHRRVARWSTDTVISIWDRGKDGKITKTTEWKVHGGPVQRIAWAHPEFGSLFAVSTEYKVQIFAELRRRSRAGELGELGWFRKACITDSEVDITDIAFAPRRLGLILATLSVEGVVRIYENTDGIDRSQWSLCSYDQAMDTRCGSISWSRSRIHQPLLAVASDDERARNNERIVIYEIDRLRQLHRIVTLRFDLAVPVTDLKFSPNAIPHSHELAVAAGVIHIYNIKVPNTDSVNNNIITLEDGTQTNATECTAYSATQVVVLDGKALRLRYNAGGTMIVADSGHGDVRAYKAMLGNKWTQMDSWDDEDLEDWDMPKDLKKEQIIFDLYHC